jgi:sec-independent protein translocase protein TatB
MSFWELVICGVVALIVLGPERLPGAIRSVSQFINGIKEFGHQMKAELGDELRAHELHQKLKDAEEKGLLNLTAAELAAIAELRQAAADVNAPYSKPADLTPTEHTEVPAQPTALPAPLGITTTSHEVQHEKPTQP